MSLNFRFIVFTSVMLGLFVLVGCSNQTYEDAMSAGSEAVEREEWNEAIEHFETALKEKSGDEDAKIAIEQVGFLHAGIEAMMDGEVDEGVKEIKEVAEGTHKFEVVIHKAEEILTYIEKIDGHLEDIDELIEKADYAEAFQQLEDLQKDQAEEKYLAAFEGRISQVEKEVKKKKLLAYMEGYVATENEVDQLIACEVTNSDIACGLILADLYYLATFDRVELLSDDALTMTMTDGSTIEVTDITETSFHMHGYTFQPVDKEEIDRKMEYITLDQHLNREEIKELIDNGLYAEVFFNYSEETTQDSESQEKMDGTDGSLEMTSLEDYTEEEIMYASIWVNRIGSPSYRPNLRVSFAKKGDRVNIYTKEAIAYPEDVVFLRGEAPTDGMITFSINGDGTINEYTVPVKWNFSGDEEILKETLKAVDSAQKKEVPSVSREELLPVLESMKISN